MGVLAALRRVADLAEAQNGMLTTRQAEARGVPRRDLARLAQGGALERVAYGVYRVSGAPRDRLVELRAAWLQLAPDVDVDQRTIVDGVVSHMSAAAVYEVGLLEPVRHEFSVPLPRRVRSRRDDVAIHRARLVADDVEWIQEILVTVPPRMVSDLCTQTMDGEHLAGVVADLVDKRLADPDAVASALGPHAERYGLPPGNGHYFLSYLLRFARGSTS